MARHIIERCGGVEETAVGVAAASEQHPRVVEHGIVFLAFHPLAVGGIVSVSGFRSRTAADGAQAYGFLGFLGRAREIAVGLGCLRVGARLGGMDVEHAREIIGIIALHGIHSHAVMLVAVEKDVVAGDEGGIAACGRGVFLQGTSLKHGEGRKDGKQQQDSTGTRHGG